MVWVRDGRWHSRHRFATTLPFSIADWTGKGQCLRKCRNGVGWVGKVKTVQEMNDGWIGQISHVSLYSCCVNFVLIKAFMAGFWAYIGRSVHSLGKLEQKSSRTSSAITSGQLQLCTFLTSLDFFELALGPATVSRG